MNKIIVIIMFFSALLIFSFDIPKHDSSQSISLAVVAGIHSNAYQIPLNSETINEYLYKASLTSGKVTFINCDGNPGVFYEANIPSPEVKGLSKTKLNTIAKEYTLQLQNALYNANAYVSEVDTLKAIQYAAQALEDDVGSERILLILDSGLSTKGYVNFTDGLLNMDTKDIVDALLEAEAVPSLSGVTVIWSYLGVTAMPQSQLNSREIIKLEEIWRSILLESGAKSVKFKNDFSSLEAYQGLPEVSTVDVSGVSLDISSIEGENQDIGLINHTFESTGIQGSRVKFIGDSDRFADVADAVDAVSDVANQLMNSPNTKVYLVGTTASGNKEFCLKLSKARAEAVMKLLIELGVNKSQMKALGLGADDPWHLEDRDHNGKLIETIAAKNRKVIIVDINSEEAKKIK